MGRRASGTTFLTPIDSVGAPVAESAVEFGRGSYTLASGTRYYFVIPCEDAKLLAVHLKGDASIIITEAALEDCNFPLSINTASGDVTNHDATPGNWIREDPSTGFVGVDGTGWSASNSVVAATGGNAGGAMWHLVDTGARRTRLSVLVGAAGGEVRVAWWAKD